MEKKLDFNFIPQSAIAINLRGKLTQEAWEIIRKTIYAIAGYRCEICDAKGKLTCHEEWDFGPDGIMRLKDLQCLCELCHHIKHLNMFGHRRELLAHYFEVNRITNKREFQLAEARALKTLEELEHVEQWQMELGKFEFLSAGINKFTRTLLQTVKEEILRENATRETL